MQNGYRATAAISDRDAARLAIWSESDPCRIGVLDGWLLRVVHTRLDRLVRCARHPCRALRRGLIIHTVHHRIGDMPGSELPVQLVADLVVHSWDLATAIGVDPGLNEQLVELAYVFCAPRMQKEVMYAYGCFKPPAQPLPDGATALERLIHPVGR